MTTAILDARLATLATRISERNGNLDELIREFAVTATARYSAAGTNNDAGAIGVAQTQFHTLTGASVTIPLGCKIVYLVCVSGSVTVTGADILSVGNASKTLSQHEYINLEYPGPTGHGEIVVDATSGSVAITITK